MEMLNILSTLGVKGMLEQLQLLAQIIVLFLEYESSIFLCVGKKEAISK